MNKSLKSISIFAFVLVILLVMSHNSNATNYYTAANGAPSTLANWWTATNGTGTHPANFTTAGDVFTIQTGHTMTTTASWTVTGTVIINSGGIFAVTSTGTTISLGAFTLDSGGTATINRPFTVSGVTSISGTISFGSTSTSNRAITFTGDITLNSGAIWNEPATGNGAGNSYNFGGNVTNNATSFNALGTGVHTFSGTAKTITGSTITSIGSTAVTGSLTNTGTLTVRTTLSGAGTLTNGNGTTGTLNIGGTITVTTLTATTANNLVNYTGVAQTAKVAVYNNLTLSGSLAKTFATTPTVNGTLSMEGTATVAVTTGAVTYGAGATLQYNTATARTASVKEWITPFLGTGGIIIKNTGAITTPGAVQIGNNTSVPLNINGGATLTPGANLITLHGDFINAGTLTSGSGGVTIAGSVATQLIDGFTTTGATSFSKTAGTAAFTGNVAGAALNIGGTAGAVLNLGTSLTHTFTGDINFLGATGGTLDGGSCFLYENNLSGTAFGGSAAANIRFTASTSTVILGGTTQTICGANTPTFYNLTVLGSSGKTFTNIPTVTNIFTIGGTCTVSVAPTFGPNATLYYNTASSRTAGVEWITPFVATGGIMIGNTGTITMNAAKVFNATAPLTISSGSTLSMSTFSLTLNGDLINNGGTASGTNGGVILTGTATQNIAAFTTTGTVSMTKTGGVATFTGNVNGGDLIINGTGGTLNLGTALTHTFTGIVTLTVGSLNGGNSALNENAVSATAWNGSGSVFTPSFSTINFGAIGNQTLAASGLSFYNLAFSGSGNKTLSSATTINSNLSVSGTAVANLGSVDHSSNSLTLGGSNQTGGTWGGTAAAPTHINDTWFLSTATGALNVNCSAPSAPTSGGNQTICSGLTIPTLSVTVGSGQTANWYSLADGGTLLASGSLTYTPVAAGTFYAEANNGGCLSASRIGVTLTINARPTVLSLNGSTICTSPGGNGTITSTSSQSGVNYQLYNSGNAAVQAAKAGTGAGLLWSGLSAGTGYYVAGTNTTTACTSTSSTINISTNSNPAALSLTGSIICTSPGGNGSITSSTSITGVNYQLYNGSNNPVQLPQPGTGAGLAWSNLTAGSGYYAIGTSIATSCISPNSNAVNVTTIANPASLVLTGSTICASPDGNGTITSTTSESGINYTLFDITGLEVGTPIPGTGSGLTWTGLSSGTGYYAVGINSTTLCISNNSNAVNVSTIPNPTITISATATGVCFSNSLQNSALSYSTITNTPINYTITWNSVAHTAGLVDVGITSLPSSPITIPVAANVAGGTYTGTLIVTNAGSCASPGNTFTLTINTAPSAPTGSATQVFCSGSTISNLAATGTGIAWYATSSGGSPLSSSTSLVNGTHYYASQTVSGCESASRLNVTANVVSTGSWIGTTSTDWFTTTNWCGGALPTSSTNVNIASGLSRYPSIGTTGAVCNNITIESGASLTIVGSNTLTVSGNWTNSGTFTANSSTVNFNGSGVGNIGTGNFYNITFSGAGTKTATGALIIAGNVSITNNFTAGSFTHTVGGSWTNNGTFTATSSTIDLNGSGAANIGTGNFNNISFSGSGAKTATGALAIAGNVSITGNFTAGSYTHTVGGNWTKTGTFTHTGSTINFNGAGAGNIGASNFNNVTFSGAGAKTATGAFNIIGSITITGNFSAGSYSHTLQGNWSNSGTFTANTSTFSFNGASAQNLGGSSNSTFANFTQNGIGVINLGISTSVSGTLTLTLGVIDIGNYNLTITSAGSISGGSATSYVKTSGTGRMTQTVPGMGGSKIYPVGNSAYDPMTVTYNDINTSKNFSIRVEDGTIANANSSKTVNRKWFLTGDVAGSSNLTLITTYNSGEEGSGFNNSSSPQIGYFDGTSWVYRPITSGSGTTTFTAPGSAPDFTNTSGFFALGSDDAFNATKLALTNINPPNPSLGLASTIITVQSQNSNSVPTMVTNATGFDLSCSNTTMSPSTPTGTISQYTYQTSVPLIAFTTSTNGNNNATVTATRTSGDVLTTGTSAVFDVIPGTIWEPVATENWDATNGWRKSTDGGSSWTNPATLPTDNIFASSELVRIPAGITLTANVTASFYSFVINGTLDINSSGNLTLNHTTFNGYNILVTGTLKNSGGTLTNNNGSYPLELIDINGGTYWHNMNGGSIPVCNWSTLSGTPSTCNITGVSSTALTAGLNQTFENFTWDNASQTVTQNLSADMTVNGALTLTAGKITTGSYHVIVGLNGTASNSGAGYINGVLRRYVSNTTTSGDFPVGDSNYYTPFSLSVTGTPSGNGYIDVSTTAAQPSSASGLSQTKYINRKWTISNNGVAGVTIYSPSFTFVNADKVGSPTTGSLKLRKFTSSTWYTTNGAATGNTITATGLSTAGLYAASDYYVGEDDCSSTNAIWLGSTSTDWNTTTNWCSGSVPTATTDVSIPSLPANQPRIGSAGGICRNITIQSGASLTISGAYTLEVKGNWLNSDTFTAATGTVSFTGISAQTITGATVFSNLTINNSAGVTASNNITVNDILTLTSANPDATHGTLDLGNHTLNMLTASASVTGSGDVTGIVKRTHTFTPNTSYQFGSQYTILNFLNTGTQPDEVSCRISIGAAPTWKTGAVQRFYSFAQTGATGTDQVTLNLSYLTSELNSNDETKLVLWDHHYTGGDTDEHGKSNNSSVNHWVGLSGRTITYVAPTSIDNKEWSLANYSATKNTWTGVVDTNWNDGTNWTGGHAPLTTEDVLIPDVSSGSNRYPVLTSDVEIKTLEISSGATLTAGSMSLTINGYNSAWQNNGIFYPGTGMVNITHGNLNHIVAISGTTQFNDITIAANTFLRPGTGSVMKISGQVNGDLSCVVDLSVNGNTVEYNGGDQYFINPSTSGYNFTGYYNLITSGTGIKTLYGNQLDISGNFTNNGTIDFGSSTVSFIGTTAQTIGGTTVPVFNNLTINNSAGVSSSTDITVNGDLYLQSDNASFTQGSLEMIVSNKLTMGINATTSGTGDVTGIVSRSHTFTSGTSYTFGNQFTTIIFASGGTYPTEMQVKTIIGTAPAWKTDAIKRVNDWIRTGGSGCYLTIASHYLDSELNGNDEAKLVRWKLTPPSAVAEIGRTAYNSTNNWVANGNIPISNLNETYGLERTYANTQLAFYLWNGSVSTDWTDQYNWTPRGNPSSISNVVIPDASTTAFSPVLPGSTEIKTLSIETGGILNAVGSEQLTVNGGIGAWSNMGVFNSSASTVIFTNSAATMAGTTNFNNVTISSGSVLTMADGSVMRISGAITNSGTWHTTIGGNTIVEYNGADQIILAPNDNPHYHNLILSGSGTKTMPATALNLHGEFIMNGTATATAGGALTLNGIHSNIILGSGTTFIAGSFIHTLAGTLENNGATFNTAGSTFTFSGTSGTIIGGTSTSTFNNLTISNSSGVTLENNETVAGTLAFTSGIITTNSNHLIVGSAGTVSGADAGKYVFGNLQKGIAASTTSKTFEIGNATNYLPVTIDFAGTATNGTGSIACSTTDGQQPYYASSGLSQTKCINRYWTVTNTGVTFGTYDATFTFINPGDKIGSPNLSALLVKEYRASSWSSTTTGTSSSTTVKTIDNTTFGDFVAGEALSQATDYFRSATTGNWSSASTWESSADGNTWNLASLTPDNNAHQITITGGTTVTVDVTATASNLYIAGTLTSGSAIGLSVKGIWENTGTFNANTGTIIFNGTSAQIISGANTFNNLTIDNAAGVSAHADQTINGILNLSSANPSSTKGALYMGHIPDPEYILHMGAISTTTGIGDASGFVNRTSFALNTDYTFGNQFTLMNFTVGPLPNSVTVEIYLPSSDIVWKTNAIRRYFDVKHAGGSVATRLRFNVHYLDSELNGATEGELDFFDYHVAANLVLDRGFTDFNTTNNWVGFGNVDLPFLGTANSDDHLWTLANSTSNEVSTWIGGSQSGLTDWDLPDNWEDGVPLGTSGVIIPGGAAYYPILPDGALPDGSLPGGRIIKTIEIQSGGVLNATTGTPTLTITGGANAWINNATFNAGSSTIVFTNAAATINGVTNFNNITVANGAGLTPVSSNIMRISGALSLSSSGILDAAANPNIIEYNGAAQTVVIPNSSTNNYTDLFLSGSGIKTVPLTALDILGDFIMAGTATTTLSATFTVSDTTTLSGSTILTLGAADILSHTSAVKLNGGTFKTGETTGYSETAGVLILSDNSTVSLGTGIHSLTFAASSGISWKSGKMLTITGWTGAYDGTSGTAGKIYIGSSTSGLTTGQLAEIRFYSGSAYYAAAILSDGEVVPTGNFITTGTIAGSPLCAGSSGISVPFTYNLAINFTGSTFTAELSNSSGSFTTFVTLQNIVSDESGSQSISVTIPSNAITGTGYRIRVVSDAPSVTGSENGIDLAVNAAGTWLGTLSIGWNTSANWCGGVPASGTNVTIPSGTDYLPHVDITTAVCNNLTINTGAALTIDAGKALSVSGTLTNNASATGLILESGASGTASLVQSTNSVPATVKRYITGNAEAWHFLSSPVSAQAISGSWLPSGTYGNGTGYDLYLWNEPNNCWIYKLNTTSTINWNTVHPVSNFVVGRGYLYSTQAVNPTKEFAGNLNNGSLSYGLTISSTDITLKGFNLVGNPYPSSIDWSASSGWIRSGLVSSGSGYDMWIWNPTAGNYGVCNSFTGSGTNDVTQYIAPMQGYFVRAASAGDLTMDNSVRVHNEANNWKNAVLKPDILSLVVQSASDNTFDEVQLQFGYARNQTGAAKLFSQVVTAPSLYIPWIGEYYSVRYLTDTVDNPMVPVMFKPGIDGNYTLTSSFGFDRFETVLLEDRQTNKLQNMKQGLPYNFAASKTDDVNRFVLHFEPVKNQSDKELPANIYTDGIHLIIDLALVSGETEIIVSDVMGRKIFEKKLQGALRHTLNFEAGTQLLVVCLKNQSGNLCRKLVWRRQSVSD